MEQSSGITLPFFLRWYVLVALTLVLYGVSLIYQDHLSPGPPPESSSTSAQNNVSEQEADGSSGKLLSNQEMSMVRAMKDCLINDFHVIAASAFQYRLRPISLGGGQGSYEGFTIPIKLRANNNATYYAQVLSASFVRITGVSTKYRSDMIAARLDEKGNLSGWAYTGNFSDLKGYSEQ